MPTKLLKSNLKAKSKALLLDVDGVIIKNRRLLSNVSTNITHYSAKKLHLSLQDAIRVNKLLYSEYGHSYRGLKKACGVTSSLDDFNHKVYDTNIMSELLELRGDFQHSLHAQHLRELAVACKTKGIPIYIFSNAPFEWCQTALDVSGLSAYVPTNNVISCDHDISRYFKSDGFKPVKPVYDKLYDYIEHVECERKTLAFVEDSFKNLLPIIGEADWIPIYFDGDIPVHNSLHIVTAKDIRYIKNVLCHSASNHQQDEHAALELLGA